VLTLTKHIKLDKEALTSPNLADRFEPEDLKRVGLWAQDGYRRDLGTRTKWAQRMNAAMDLAMQIQKGKSFPWEGCSNVAFPLVTIATMQYHARAYPSIIDGTQVVKMRVLGDDPDGALKARADRVSTYMSWQVLEEDEGWEEGQDSLLINYAVMGTAFKKSYRDSSKGRNASELVFARDLVLDYWTASLPDCPRMTHVIPLYRNEIYEKAKRGEFCDVLEEAWYKATPADRTTEASIQAEKDNRAGTSKPQGDETTPFITLEQHVSVDLDGDGYAEPYIITIEDSTGTVLRIVTNFERVEDIERKGVNAAGTPGWWNDEIIKITPLQYFTRYVFLPSPDGGIYGLGFGILLGPLNEAVNSLINQLVDAGTMATTAGGFLARSAKMRSGTYRFSPLEWKRVDASGDDLQKSIYPLPVREPSNVLFQLLGLLIEYTNRISGTTETLVGENPGQNTPAETSRTMLEQGEKVYSAIFKRCWRSMKEEFKKLYKLNGMYMEESVKFGQGKGVMRSDFLSDPRAIVPAADPNITSRAQKVQLASTLKQVAYTTPGYNYVEAEKNWLHAMGVEGADVLYPGPGKTPKDLPPLGGEDPKITVAKIKAEADTQTKMAKLQVDQALFAQELMHTYELNQAKIMELMASAEYIMADAENLKDDKVIKRINAHVEMMRQQNAQVLERARTMLEGIRVSNETKEVEIAERESRKPAPVGGGK